MNSTPDQRAAKKRAVYASARRAASDLRALQPAQLQLFALVARTGSFSEAGRAFGVTQSAVSQAIERLERQLELVLLSAQAGQRSSLRRGAKFSSSPRGCSKKRSAF